MNIGGHEVEVVETVISHGGGDEVIAFKLWVKSGGMKVANEAYKAIKNECLARGHNGYHDSSTIKIGNKQMLLSCLSA